MHHNFSELLTIQESYDKTSYDEHIPIQKGIKNMVELIISLPADKYSQDQIRLILAYTPQAPLASVTLCGDKLNFKFSPYELGEDTAPYTKIATAICEEALLKYAAERS